ncbi:hypothetical protein psal_cds_1024 [Pandoravirus salinus]|uniref:Uncharacterized protein n=1 Tax=Pandoravirus salinus TaxID=1349410 RepID=S4VXV9_9VIRU|nr:hypothetical protein psal_cds_1024 [Pandoravirus salinus]AGO85208.2 hypothetical protein psal_cds_1024 [Pandoravirus salinus]
MLASTLSRLHAQVADLSADLEASRGREREYAALVGALRRRETQLQHEITNLSTILDLCRATKEEEEEGKDVQERVDGAILAVESTVAQDDGDANQTVGGSDSASGPTHSPAHFDRRLSDTAAADKSASFVPCEALPPIASRTHQSDSGRLGWEAVGDHLVHAGTVHDAFCGADNAPISPSDCRCTVRAHAVVHGDVDQSHISPESTIASNVHSGASRNLSWASRRRLFALVLVLVAAAVILTDSYWLNGHRDAVPVSTAVGDGCLDAATYDALFAHDPLDAGNNAQLPPSSFAWRYLLLPRLYHDGHDPR